MLTHVVNLIAVAEVTVQQSVMSRSSKTVADLKTLHRKVQEGIRDVIRWGYIPAEEAMPAKVGDRMNPIVSVEHHDDFVRAFFAVRRQHQDSFAPIAFFTTNYDTLLEDAGLASRAIP